MSDKSTKNSANTPENRVRELGYTELRVALIKRGISLRRFALTHGYSIPTVYLAAHGRRLGVKTTKIRKHLHAEASHDRVENGH